MLCLLCAIRGSRVATPRAQYVSTDSDLFCGWGVTNTAFRSVMDFVVVITAAVTMIGMKQGWDFAETVCSWMYLVCAVCFASVMTLDANSIRVGNKYCQENISFTGANVSCHPTFMAGLAIADGFEMILLGVTFYFSRLYASTMGTPSYGGNLMGV